MANGTLSSYFEKEKAKGTKAGGASPYSAPADAGGSAPSGGGPSAPSAPSAPKGSPGGGTGFVSFGQYFGGNAPAIQQQAQGVVGRAPEQKAPTVPQGAPGLGTFKTASFGPTPAAFQMGQRQAAGPSPQNPYTSQISQTAAQMEALNPAAQSGDMGENVSAFDQLLGGGVTQRAAKGEQQRLGTLRAALEGQQGQWQAEQENARIAKEQKYDAFLKQGGSSKTYNQLTEDEKRWVQSAVDGTRFV